MAGLSPAFGLNEPVRIFPIGREDEPDRMGYVRELRVDETGCNHYLVRYTEVDGTLQDKWFVEGRIGVA